MQCETRDFLVQRIEQTALYDLIIIGGGIHGATLAELAAKNDLSVLLLEKEDYASGTSSRSSKMAHGGLRYLELFDFEQVFEGIKAREKLFADFPEMVKPYRFAVPVLKGKWWFRLKLGVGLYLYDLMTSKKERKYTWVPKAELGKTGFSGSSLDLMGCYLYTDGILRDARLVLHRILNARAAGAHCLNYAAVEAIESGAHEVAVTWTDTASGTQRTSRARYGVNCAGPWAPLLDGQSLGASDYPVRYSRGIHLLFNVPWEGPALFLPMEGKARYYFVWPHPAGALIGTTEGPTDLLEDDPYPHKEEVQEILLRVQHDLPASNLNEKTLHYAFAGVRTLPLRRDKRGESGSLSRKHIWRENGRMLSLLGGKLTTAEWTAREGLKKVCNALSRQLSARRDPEAPVSPTIIDNWRKTAAEQGFSARRIEQLLQRYGSRVIEVYSSLDSYVAVTDSVSKGEIDYAIRYEQAQSVQDLMRRRLELEYLPGAGLEDLPAISRYLEENGFLDATGLSAQCAEYTTIVRRSLDTIAEVRGGTTVAGE